MILSILALLLLLLQVPIAQSSRHPNAKCSIPTRPPSIPYSRHPSPLHDFLNNEDLSTFLTHFQSQHYIFQRSAIPLPTLSQLLSQNRSASSEKYQLRLGHDLLFARRENGTTMYLDAQHVDFQQYVGDGFECILTNVHLRHVPLYEFTRSLAEYMGVNVTLQLHIAPNTTKNNVVHMFPSDSFVFTMEEDKGDVHLYRNVERLVHPEFLPQSNVYEMIEDVKPLIYHLSAGNAMYIPSGDAFSVTSSIFALQMHTHECTVCHAVFASIAYVAKTFDYTPLEDYLENDDEERTVRDVLEAAVSLACAATLQLRYFFPLVDITDEMEGADIEHAWKAIQGGTHALWKAVLEVLQEDDEWKEWASDQSEENVVFEEAIEWIVQRVRGGHDAIVDAMIIKKGVNGREREDRLVWELNRESQPGVPG